MSLAVRLARAYVLFGIIFMSYMVELGLERVFRKFERDPETGRERRRLPAWLWQRRLDVDARNAKRLLRGILKLHGVYIKLGQVLSIMGGLLPRVYADELEVLQDQVPPRSFEEVRRVILESFGKPETELFAKVDSTPLAAASLGQVHRARTHDGREVAVKILYPGIRDIIRTDMQVVQMAMVVYGWFVPVQNLDTAYDALVDLLRRETDYVHEAQCMRRMGENMKRHDDILVPEVVDELSRRDVLTMTFMEGVKITDFEGLAEIGVDRNQVATRLTECFYEQLFIHRFFHADPHPGNFLVQAGPDGAPRLVILDFGAISEVPDAMIDGMVDVLQGFFEQNDSLVVAGVKRIGFVAEGGNRALVEKTIITYFRKLLQVPDRSAGALMRVRREELQKLVDPEVERRELRELMKSIHYPDGWFYVERASVLLFWLVAQIDPEVDTLQVGFPYVLPLLAKRTRARAEEASMAASAPPR